MAWQADMGLILAPAYALGLVHLYNEQLVQPYQVVMLE